jgi:hypothetical protein
MLSVCAFPLLTLEYLTQFYGSRYEYHGASAHLNGVLKKSIPSICVSVRGVANQR